MTHVVVNMNIFAAMTFVWYADHPRDGELILAIPSDNAFRYSYIYSPRIIRERIGKRMNPLVSLELSLGPHGFVPRQYYEEAGMTARTPFSIRLLAMKDKHRDLFGLDESHLGQHDEELSSFMLNEWKKFTNAIDANA